MMKSRLWFLMVLVGMGLAPLFAQETPENLVKIVLAGISADFSEKNPKIAFHPTVAVLNIEEVSEDAKKHRISDALYPLLESLLHRSTVFELLERKNLEAVLKEQELTLTGLTAEGKLSMGGLKEAEYLLKGSISELGENLQLSLSLISVQDGSIQASRTGTILKSILIASADEFSAKYVSPYGIGIELQVVPATYFQLQSQGVTNGISAGLNLNYRLSKAFVLNFGVENVFITRALKSTLTTETGKQQQPLLQTQSISNLSFSSPGTIKVDYGDTRNLTSLFVGVAGVLNASKELNFSLGANLRMSFLDEVQRYSLTGLNSEVNKPAPINVNATTVGLYAEPIFKIQWYLNPRLTLSLGYSFDIRLAELTAQVYYTYSDQRFTANGGVPIKLAGFDLSPWIDPFSGQSLTYDFSAHRIYVSLGFYF